MTVIASVGKSPDPKENNHEQVFDPLTNMAPQVMAETLLDELVSLLLLVQVVQEQPLQGHGLYGMGRRVVPVSHQYPLARGAFARTVSFAESTHLHARETFSRFALIL